MKWALLLYFVSLHSVTNGVILNCSNDAVNKIWLWIYWANLSFMLYNSRLLTEGPLKDTSNIP